MLIAFWRIDTLPCAWDDQTAAHKAAGWETKATAVLDQLDNERNRLGIPTAKMAFVAPEHLFRRSSTSMAMAEADKRTIVAKVRTVSSRYADALIIPGTVVWLEEGWFARKFNRKFEARNSAFVYCGGTELFRYDKHADAGELTDAEKNNAKFVAGKKLGVFSYWGKRFGLEICFDHSNSVLFNQLQAKRKSAVDMHIVIASSVPNQSGKVAARSGGLLVHADGGDTRHSHEAQPGNKGARTGVWDVTEHDQPLSGAHVDNVAADKRLNRGLYMQLQRRPSFTRAAPDVPVAEQFQGFDPDVSVYKVTF